MVTKVYTNGKLTNCYDNFEEYIKAIRDEVMKSGEEMELKKVRYGDVDGDVCHNCRHFTSVENGEVVDRCDLFNEEIFWNFNHTCDRGLFGVKIIGSLLGSTHKQE